VCSRGPFAPFYGSSSGARAALRSPGADAGPGLLPGYGEFGR